MTRSLTLIVDAADAGLRVDIVLGRRVSGLSRRAARALGLRGRIRVDEVKSPPSRIVRAGDAVRIELAPDDAEPRALVVLAVTDDFVYVHKPAGIHTHRLGPDEPAALADGVAHQFPECTSASAEPREGGAIARLDRATSGVVAFARSADAWRRGRAAMADPRTRKHYVAITRGVPTPAWPPALPEAVVALDAARWWEHWHVLPQPQSVVPVRLTVALGRGTDRRRVAVRQDGRTSHTVLTPLATNASGHTVFAVALGRGFRHQIRVVLAWLGTPIAGDARYGAPADDDAPVLMLHCGELDLSACCAGEQRVVAPPDPRAGVGSADLNAWLQDPTWRPFAAQGSAW